MLSGPNRRITLLSALFGFLFLAGAVPGIGPGVSQASDILVMGLFKDMVILRVGNTRHKLRKGESTPQGIKLISANSDKAVLEINGRRESYSLGTHTHSISFGKKEKKTSEARIWSNRGMFLTSGLINGSPVNFLVDTGATWVAMSIRDANKLGIDYRKRGRKSVANTASGVAVTWIIDLKSVKVGGIELQQVKGAVIEGAGPKVVLLGMSFLSRVKMQHEGQLLLLQKTR